LLRFGDEPTHSRGNACFRLDALSYRGHEGGAPRNTRHIGGVEPQTHVDQIQTVRLELLHEYDGFLERLAVFGEVAHTKPSGEWKLLRPYFAHSAEGIEQKPRPVVEAASVFIG